MAADDEDNEVDGEGATGDGATGDYGDDDDYGDGRWMTTTMSTARRATKSTMMVTAQRAKKSTMMTMAREIETWSTYSPHRCVS